ncbi:MAG: hypothetical protein JNN18_14850 [Rubrivivax sp.]|jgi:hypothetical protein|nr:hypothetical protein [Rubrivivax sp.]
MKDRSSLVLHAVLRLFKPLARLLLQNGVGYPAFAAALKRVFLEAARDELAARSMPATDSAITLLCGVHRRDVRTLSRAPDAASAGDTARKPFSLAAEVATRWLSDRRHRSSRGQLRTLARGAGDDTFDALVASVSSDIRPRAVLDELKRLGVAEETADGRVRLLAQSFAPRQGFEELSWLFADNLHDHLAAAAKNLQGEGNFLEQAVFVDELTEASAAAMQQASVQAWKQAFGTVMARAHLHYEQDAREAPPEARRQRVRFGVYFFNDTMDGSAST